MKIALGSDHRGFTLKQQLQQWLQHRGHEVIDEGTSDDRSVDYTDFAEQVCCRVVQGEVERGILICGTGIGMSITANKFPGIRAATCGDEQTAGICRRHNDVNVLCLSGDTLVLPQAQRIVDVWIDTPFEGGRHQRRIDKIGAIERTRCSEKPDCGSVDEQSA
jgi:ribose 5-phosphate isomerase B